MTRTSLGFAAVVDQFPLEASVDGVHTLPLGNFITTEGILAAHSEAIRASRYNLVLVPEA
jgi:hypothetical protein